MIKKGLIICQELHVTFVFNLALFICAPLFFYKVAQKVFRCLFLYFNKVGQGMTVEPLTVDMVLAMSKKAEGFVMALLVFLNVFVTQQM